MPKHPLDLLGIYLILSILSKTYINLIQIILKKIILILSVFPQLLSTKVFLLFYLFIKYIKGDKKKKKNFKINNKKNEDYLEEYKKKEKLIIVMNGGLSYSELN